MTALFASTPGQSGPRFVSHRGFTPLAPENSLPGFAYAGLLRQWAIETDVHATADGVLVCCHDETVERTYDGAGLIREMTWSDLSRLRLRTGSRLECFGDDERQMPPLADYLRICKAYGSVPFIELKAPEGERVMREVQQAGLDQDEVVISSTRLPWLEEVRKFAPRVFLHHIFSDDAGLERLAELGNAGLSWKISDPDALPEGAISRAHARGVRVCLRAADSRSAVEQMGALGLDYLPTNTMHRGLWPGMPPEGNQVRP